MRADEPISCEATAPSRRYGIGEIHVVACGDGWRLARAVADEAGRRYGTEAEAVAAARKLARAEGGRVVVQGPDGPVRGGLILGRLAFERLSAVEGIHLTEAMRQDFRALDEADLSDDERRRVLAEKYGGAHQR